MKTGEILSAAFCAGKKHDFQLFKESGIELPSHVLLLADLCFDIFTFFREERVFLFVCMHSHCFFKSTG
jgi:hypothetical protein